MSRDCDKYNEDFAQLAAKPSPDFLSHCGHCPGCGAKLQEEGERILQEDIDKFIDKGTRTGLAEWVHPPPPTLKSRMETAIKRLLQVQRNRFLPVCFAIVGIAALGIVATRFPPKSSIPPGQAMRDPRLQLQSPSFFPDSSPATSSGPTVPNDAASRLRYFIYRHPAEWSASPAWATNRFAVAGNPGSPKKVLWNGTQQQARETDGIWIEWGTRPVGGQTPITSLHVVHVDWTTTAPKLPLAVDLDLDGKSDLESLPEPSTSLSYTLIHKESGNRVTAAVTLIGLDARSMKRDAERGWQLLSLADLNVGQSGWHRADWCGRVEDISLFGGPWPEKANDFVVASVKSDDGALHLYEYQEGKGECRLPYLSAFKRVATGTCEWSVGRVVFSLVVDDPQQPSRIEGEMIVNPELPRSDEGSSLSGSTRRRLWLSYGRAPNETEYTGEFEKIMTERGHIARAGFIAPIAGSSLQRSFEVQGWVQDQDGLDTVTVVVEAKASPSGASAVLQIPVCNGDCTPNMKFKKTVTPMLQQLGPNASLTFAILTRDHAGHTEGPLAARKASWRP